MASTLLLLFSLVAVANACTLAPGGCTAKICTALKKLSVNQNLNPLFGYKYGSWNKNVSRTLENKRGGPVVSLEYYTEIGKNGSYLMTTKAKNLGDCCLNCAKTSGCTMFQFFLKGSVSTGKEVVAGFVPGAQCYLLNAGSYTKKASLPAAGVPYSGSAAEQKVSAKVYDPSWVGGLCNPVASVKNDPHFRGALGTDFDFNGELNKPFCLITDRTFHLNVLLKGYTDDTSDIGMRSWIKGLGLLWTSGSGGNVKVHTALLSARSGKQQERGDGFMSRLEVDGASRAVPVAEGQEVRADGFALTFMGIDLVGPYEVEHFLLEVAGVARLHLRLRVAHKMLQTANDVEVHFNVEVEELKRTPAVHGVLGQTFRKTNEQMRKALKYSELAELLHAPVRADGESGKGFLDGSVKDYESSSVLSPDCGFSAFNM